MPFINLYVKQGLSDCELRQITKSVTEAVATNLENTLPRMVRVCIYEIPAKYFYAAPRSESTRAPTLTLQLGPGRSDEAIVKCVNAVVDAVHKSLSIPREEVRFYVERVPGENFAIGGKLKDFSKKVN